MSPFGLPIVAGNKTVYSGVTVESFLTTFNVRVGLIQFICYVLILFWHLQKKLKKYFLFTTLAVLLFFINYF